MVRAIALALVAVSAFGAGLDLDALALGAPETDVMRLVARDAVDRIPEGIVVAGSPFPRLFERQRTLLRIEEGRLAAIRVLVVPEPDATGDDLMRTWTELRAVLTRRLGPPEWERREGEAAGDELLYALADGSVVRVAQWRASEARWVRAGIVRRENGSVAAEVAITRTPIPRGAELWSEPALRD